ncbi:TonB-dependent receptor [Massilia sp. METH4]|uniref:TonB-dependent receptor n=1 Tax=Massilia sp. METH4 TaxID=3123041 RepID=UPI0030D32431
MRRTPLSAILFGPVVLFGLIALPAAAEPPAIATVTITAGREPVARKLDKTVHDVSAMPRAANGTAQDVLQSTPGIAVSADGRISVQGNPQVTVLVDGKPTAVMAGEERAVALQTMNGADIASVEIITNPSAAHQANGGAIVNIVLKRNRKPGARAQWRASAADHGLWNTGLSGDVNGNRFSVHGELGVRRDGTLKTRRSAVDWTDPPSGRTGQARQASEVFVRRTVESAAAGIEYDLGAAETLSLSARHNARRSRPLLDTLNVVHDEAGARIYHRISEGPNEQTDGSASLAYSRQGNGTVLKTIVQRSRTVTLVDKSYRDVFVQPVHADAFSHGSTRSARRLDQATLDWSRKSGQGQWGMGVDLQDEVNELANYQAAVDPVTGAETPDAGTTNAYDVATTLSAAYLTHLARGGKWEALLGGRIERMTRRVHPAGGTSHAAHWRAFNPSLHLRYAASEWVDLTLAYRRSLQRPDSRDLNPFTTYVDAQNLSRGNPSLEPQVLASWEIGADVKAGPLSGNLGAFYRGSRDTVTDARTLAGNAIVTGKQNGGRARSAGVTGALDWAPRPKLRLGMDGGAYRVMLFTPDGRGMVRQAGLSGYLNARVTCGLGDDDVSLDAHMQSAGMTPLARHGATSSVNVTWKRRLTRTLSLTVNASDIFDGSKRTYRTRTNSFHQEGFDHFVARRFQVGLLQTFE